jgi:phosphomevalonate kinase
MSIARAPGKVVLSGAYSVLSGAPAIVCSVGRYVLADSARPAALLTAEVAAALAPGNEQSAPWFDASALREGERKLGLGSSAAILVASLYVLLRDAQPELAHSQLVERVFARALVAHRVAQGGGSGVDVASAAFGGTLGYRLLDGEPVLAPLALPSDLTVELWTCPEAASTRELLGAVRELGARSPDQHQRLLSAQALAAEQALSATERADGSALVAALRAQHRALHALGQAAGARIVTSELAELSAAAESENGVLLPAGAGGGDMALFVGFAPSTRALRAALQARAHQLLPVALSVPGVGPG